MPHLGLTTSKEKVHFNGGATPEDLVPKNQIVCWEFLFKKKSIEYIQNKLNDGLVQGRKVVIVPANNQKVFSESVVLNPHKSESVLTAIRVVLPQKMAGYDVVVKPLEENTALPQENPPVVPRQKKALSEKEVYCFETLFGGKNIKTIEDVLNIIWLPPSHKAIIIPSACEVVLYNPKEPESLVVNTQELLEQSNSWFTIELIAAESSKFSLMEAI